MLSWLRTGDAKEVTLFERVKEWLQVTSRREGTERVLHSDIH